MIQLPVTHFHIPLVGFHYLLAPYIVNVCDCARYKQVVKKIYSNGEIEIFRTAEFRGPARGA